VPKIPFSQILKDFVDRTREVAGFESLFNDSPKRIIGIYGPGGMGKSALLNRMIETCDSRGTRWVYIEWRDSRRYNYLDMMRIIREDTVPSLFALFNDRVNFHNAPQYRLQIPLEGGNIQNVKVLSGGEVRQSGVTVHVGHSIEIKDLNLNMPRPDRNVTDNEILIDLTRAFMPCLQAVTAEKPLVIFFDALEKADKLTLDWIWEELLARVRDRDVTNLFVALAGREPIEPEPSFFDCIDVYEMQPFQTDNVLEYLEKRQLGRLEDLARFILANFGGNPLQIAQSVNNFLRFQNRR